MADPLDVLRRRGDSAQPDPAFRSALMAELRRAMTRDDAHSSPLDTGTEPAPLEVVVSTSQSPSPSTPSGPSRRYVAIGAAAAAVVAIVVTGLLVSRDDDVEPAAGLPIATDATSSAAAATSIVETVDPTTVAPTTVAPTTVPPLTDDEIAAAGLLSADEVGDGYQHASGVLTFTLDRAGGPGTTSPACSPFLETVFENADRPASVDVRGFRTVGAAMQQQVIVFADQADAEAMMAAVGDPGFPACLGAITTEAYTAMDPPELTARSALVPAEARPLRAVGDDMVVLRVTGTYVFGGTTFDDDGLTPFVRVGRAVTWMNPNSAVTAINTPGYPDSQLEQALESAAAHLRAAQGV